MPISHVLARGLVVLILVFALPASLSAEGKKGIGGLFRASSKSPTATSEVNTESGPVAKACGLRGKALGKVVEKGPGGWKLYDTAPGSTAVRDFHVTGFSDGCARKVSGAVAMFGSVELYELVHYGPVGMKPKGTDTDKAYAEMRARACGSAKMACKPGALRKLTKQAVFVDVYASASSPRRTQLLMSRGKLAALSQK
ncbi:hypothetical protein [Aliiruegeria lutimaris]|uniref:Uncharacterized protein n=1 Tax=Aliiruegeria lutimaris TaxID=571298 RepID=A0A1G8Y7W2_9RHOB|nr:hypothetical protein [Aliiruegeria lutimaris]SDJ98801.1 hypothetical protein SAMN04488026_102841 [Aliiruegeria lutimaris]